MKLGRQISTTQFVISNIFIFILSLAFLFGIYYILNIQYQKSSTDPFSKGPITTAPKTLRLDLNHPDNDTLTFQSNIIVSGRTAPGKDVLIFTQTQDVVITSKRDGSFSTVLELDEGVNRITVAVFDQTGDSRSIEKTVYYSKEKV